MIKLERRTHALTHQVGEKAHQEEPAGEDIEYNVGSGRTPVYTELSNISCLEPDGTWKIA
jgi:hypothetical protein